MGLKSGGSQGNCAHRCRAGPFRVRGGFTMGDRGWIRAAPVVADWRGALFRGRWAPLRLRRLKANSYPSLIPRNGED